MRFDKILVPLDGSILAEAALWKAVEIAGGGTLSLLRAAEAHTMPGADQIDAQVAAVREAEEYLASVARRLAGRGLKKVETHVWYGPPAAAILEAAETQKSDVIVMSTHGRSGLGRLILGSVAESVLRGTRTPILVVRADSAPLAPQRGATPAKETTRV
jgi:nucleotide-binding universal stress UspA family protein